MYLEAVRKHSKPQSRTRHTPVLEGKNLHNCVGNFDFFFLFLWFTCFACVPFMFRLRRGVTFCLRYMLLMTRRLFVFVLSFARLMTRNLEDIMRLHQKFAQSSARYCCSPLDPHHYTFAGHPNSLNSFISLLPGLLFYRLDCCIPRFGSFAARSSLYALAKLDFYSAPRYFLSACSSGPQFSSPFFRLMSPPAMFCSARVSSFSCFAQL